MCFFNIVDFTDLCKYLCEKHHGDSIYFFCVILNPKRGEESVLLFTKLQILRYTQND